MQAHHIGTSCRTATSCRHIIQAHHTGAHHTGTSYRQLPQLVNALSLVIYASYRHTIQAATKDCVHLLLQKIHVPTTHEGTHTAALCPVYSPFRLHEANTALHFKFLSRIFLHHIKRHVRGLLSFSQLSIFGMTADSAYRTDIQILLETQGGCVCSALGLTKVRLLHQQMQHMQASYAKGHKHAQPCCCQEGNISVLVQISSCAPATQQLRFSCCLFVWGLPKQQISYRELVRNACIFSWRATCVHGMFVRAYICTCK